MDKNEQDKVSDLFEALVESALDFLQHSLAEIEKQHKYSVIHFCSGIEIFLKARLLLENWELVVEDEKLKPDLEIFIQGGLNTVGIEKAVKRLNSNIKIPIREDAKKCFKELAEHRNKYIHFFQKRDETTIYDIVGGQCRGWHYLHHLLTIEWDPQFKGYISRIDNIHDLISRKRRFLQERFTLIAGSLKTKARARINIFECHICHFKAANGVPSENTILCEVCKDQSNALRVLCNQYGHENHFYLDNIAEVMNKKCRKCNSDLQLQFKEILPIFIHEMGVEQTIEDIRSEKSPKEIIEALLRLKEVDEVIKNVREVLGVEDLIEGLSQIYEQEQNTPAYCLDCEGEYEDQPTVLYVNGKYLCLNCDEIHSMFSHCDSCDRDLAGDDTDATYKYDGCRFCDKVVYTHIEDDEDL